MNVTLDVLFNESTKIDTIIKGILAFFNIIIFPFYAYCYNINRERDEKTAVFPLTNRLFQIVQRSYIPIIFCVMYAVLIILYLSSPHPFSTVGVVLFVGSTVLCAFIAYTLYLTTQTVHLIIFILAVERFCIYFCPSINISLLPKYTISLINLIYGLLIIKDIAMIYGYYHKFDYHKLMIFYGSVSVIFNVLVLISAFLYIPIVITIRKLKTNRQGFYQTISIFGFKIISLPILFKLIATSENVIFSIIWHSVTTDVIVILLVIQFSYMGCNRKTLKGLFINFNLKMFINTVIDRKPSRVEPSVQIPEECVNETKV